MPGTTNITGRKNTSPSPPLPSMAFTVVGSCQIAKRANSPIVLSSAANAVVAMPDRPPARILPLFHEAKNPETSNIEIATRVEIKERVWKSAGGCSHVPLLLYGCGLRLVSRQVLILTTVGRKTGQLRSTPLGYAFDPAAETYSFIAGWKARTNWYRNALVSPAVQVRVGAKLFYCCQPPPSA